MIIEPAARSAEELALLRGIADHPGQDLPRLMYADWLEERSDPRGPFLREFVQAVRAGKPLPDADVPAAWADLVGVAILKAAAEAEMREFADQFLSHARPAIRLDVSEVSFDDPPEPPEALGTTRLGGDPDLPAGSEFPTDSRGGALHFLGQFALEELHGFVGGRAFPADGLLSIFRTQAEGKNCYPGPADCPRFVRHIPKGTQLERFARPEGNGEPPAPYRPDLGSV